MNGAMKTILKALGLASRDGNGPGDVGREQQRTEDRAAGVAEAQLVQEALRRRIQNVERSSRK